MRSIYSIFLLYLWFTLLIESNYGIFMKKANYANSFKTLIINSCGKVKVVSQPDQPACDDLTTSEKRKKKSKISVIS